MSKILIIAIGSAGDVHPMIGVAKALMARGHETTVAINEHFSPLFEKVGVPAICLWQEQEYLKALHSKELWHPRKAIYFVMKALAEAGIEPVYKLIEELRPDVVAATPLALGARVAQEKMGVPYATLHFAPAMYFTVNDPPRFPLVKPWWPQWLIRGYYHLSQRMIDPAIAPQVNAFRKKVGLGGTVRHIVKEYWLSPELQVNLFPKWFMEPSGRLPADLPKQAVFTDFPLYDESDIAGMPAELEEFLGAGSAPLAFTPGSAMVQGADFFRESLAYVRGAKRRGIFLTRHGEQLPAGIPTLGNEPLTGSAVIHVPWIPLSRLLPRCAAFVSHGGIGSVAQGLAAGIPQVCMTMAHDQPDNAYRLERLGVGRELGRPRYRAKRLGRVLESMLSDQAVLARAKELAAKIRPMEGLSRAVGHLEGLVGGSAPLSRAALAT